LVSLDQHETAQKMELRSSSFNFFSISFIWRDIDTKKILKIINDGETHLMIGPTTFFLCLSIS